jgi:ketosteroid isomerase-like protein
MGVDANRALMLAFRDAQREMYAGGAPGPVLDLLAEDVVWHVPGGSPIAGDHRGREAVLAYFLLRRALARDTMRIAVLQSMADDEVVVELADGTMELDDAVASWRTTGVYRIEGGAIAEAWLVPLDLDRFDAIWSATRR